MVSKQLKYFVYLCDLQGTKRELRAAFVSNCDARCYMASQQPTEMRCWKYVLYSLDYDRDICELVNGFREL